MFELALELDVLWHTEETRKLEETGIDYNPEDLEHRTMTFYTVDNISPNYWDDNHEYCNLFSGGEKYIIPKTYDEVKRIIHDAKQHGYHNSIKN